MMKSTVSPSPFPRASVVERRRYPRRRVVRAARLCCGDVGTPEPCVVLDVSEGGARIHVHRELARDCALCLALPDDAPFVACEIVWCRNGEIGVRYTEAVR